MCLATRAIICRRNGVPVRPDPESCPELSLLVVPRLLISLLLPHAPLVFTLHRFNFVVNYDLNDLYATLIHSEVDEAPT